MEDIISKLAEIEAAASHIMEDVSEQKKELAQQYDQAMRDFDQAVDDEIMAKKQSWKNKDLMQTVFCVKWKPIIKNVMQNWQSKFMIEY